MSRTKRQNKPANECKICKDIPDHVSYSDPFDHPEDNPQDVRKTLEAIEKLVRVSEHWWDDNIKKCPSCGSLYIYDFHSIPYSDHDELQVDRFSAEAVRLFKIFSESNDEKELAKAFEETLPENEGSLPIVNFGWYRISTGDMAKKIRIIEILLSSNKKRVLEFVFSEIGSLARTGKDISPFIPRLVKQMSYKKDSVREKAADALKYVVWKKSNAKIILDSISKYKLDKKDPEVKKLIEKWEKRLEV